MMRILLTLIMSFMISAASAAEMPSENSAEFWLLKMAQSLRKLDYDISFVVLQPSTPVEPYRWRHAIVNGKEMEHLSLLNGPGREIVRIDDIVSFFEPNVTPYSVHSDTISGPIPAVLFRQPLELESAYSFVLVGKSRVSGRPTQQVRIVCKDKTRYGFNLWLDQDTGLLLKVDMVDGHGRVLEQIQVTSLKVTQTPAPLFAKLVGAKLPPVTVTEDNDSKPLPWELSWLPEGMHVVKQDRHRLSLTGKMVDYLLLSDGMVDVSVYLQKYDPANGGNNYFLHGADTYYSYHQGSLDVTILGKIPPKTADQIARGVKLRPQT